MAYQRLKLSTTTPSVVRHFIEGTIENHYFSDIHAMLRLPLPEQEIVAGQNFAITQVLMAVISGISITLYDKKGRPGDLFKAVIKDYFPWNEEPANDVPPKAAAGIIYEVFRNPLTHAGGLFVDMREDQRYLVQKSYSVRVNRIMTPDKLDGHSEEWIEALETALERPHIDQTLKVRNEMKVINIEGLYWCVRRMIQKLTDDKKKMIT
ncbi:MAG: hypothetical protein AB2669_13635 [Candidatus Thiodiazotropha endolucinida]